MRQLHEKTSWEGQKHLDRCIGGNKWARGVCVCVVFPSSSVLTSVAPESPHLLSQIIWIPFLCPLPPHDGLIPVTSTEAPVMYPLSSDAKNATTSATSMGTVRRGQNPTHFHRPKGAIIFHQKYPFPPKHTHQPPILVRPSQIPDFGICSPRAFPRTHSPVSAHPEGPPNVPLGSFQSPVRKHSSG